MDEGPSVAHALLVVPGVPQQLVIGGYWKRLMMGGIGGQEEKGTTEDEMAGWHH